MFKSTLHFPALMFSILLLGSSACSDDAASPADLGLDLPARLPDATRDLALPDVTLDLPPPDLYPGCTDGGVSADLGLAGVTVSGDVLNFFGSPNRIVGAGVTVLESPCRKVVSDSKGFFSLSGLKVGSELTLLLAHKDFPPQQTGTLTIPAGGAKRFSFQAVSHFTYKALAAIAGVKPVDTNCQIATTVTAYGKSVYTSGAHGEEGATVTITPALPQKHGPIYFNSQVLPEPKLTQTSDDGGVIFLNVPPGTYTLTAQKKGVTFRPVKIKCRAGWLANASPPWGIQVIK